MKKLVIFALVVCLGMYARAATSITTPTVSGHWTLAGSPYKIYNDINIGLGNTLTIDPGVEIIFEGYYGIVVDGVLNAIGNKAQPISFRVQDTTGWYIQGNKLGGWPGIHFTGFSSTIEKYNSAISFCVFSDMKDRGLAMTPSAFNIKECEFYHNNGANVSVVTDTSRNFEMTSCYFHDNISDVRLIEIYNTKAKVSNCRMVNNKTLLDLLYGNNLKLSFEDNIISKNTQRDSGFAATIYLENCKGIVKGNKIHDNTSIYDGALSCARGQLDIIGNNICNNQTLVGFNNGTACGSVEGGGAIRITSEGALDEKNYFNIHNNLIANNHASYQGGGIYAFFANVNITNNTLVNNDGGSDAHIFIYNNSYVGHSNVTIQNNLFYNTTGLRAGQTNVLIQAGDTVSYGYNWTQYGFSKDIDTSTAAFSRFICDTITNVIGANPGIKNTTKTSAVTESALASDLGLVAGSSCINRGVALTSYLSPYDYAGNKRVSDGRIDIGAYEWQLNLSSPLVGNDDIIAVYPNPVSSTLFIAVPEATGYVIINDLAGRTIKQQPVKDRVTTVDISDIANGIYLAIWNNGTSLTTRKFVVQ